MIKIDKNLVDQVIRKASASERKRANHNFHQFAGDTLQRMINVLNTNTYVRPHKHDEPDKREAFILLEGKVAIVEFDNFGTPTQTTLLDRNALSYGCEIAPKTWHMLICLQDNSVIYELKDGPYNPLNDKQFAPWSPEEGTDDAIGYLNNLIKTLKL
jgi:cupin fold WbuC family metalloprotein